jgi:putative endonuclease
MRLFNRSEPKPEHLTTGEWGEKLAAVYLKKVGYKILGRRVRVGTRDELDIVARDGKVLVFVEVKTRKSELYGRAISAVDRAKRHTLSRAAVRYIKRLNNPKICFRFDVVEVVGSRKNSEPPEIRHIENAFSLERRYQLP